MSRCWLVCAALAGALLPGCGGGTKTVTVSTASTTSSVAASTPDTSTSTTSTDTGPPQCSSQRTFVGKCVADNGSTLIYANRGSSVRLKTMRVKVVNVDTPQFVSNGSGFTANAHGTFVIVTVAVTNTTSSPKGSMRAVLQARPNWPLGRTLTVCHSRPRIRMTQTRL